MMPDRWVYYFADGNVRRGPYGLEKLRTFPLLPETLVWRQGMPEWAPMRDVPELWAIFAERYAPRPELVTPEPPSAAPASIGVPQTTWLQGVPGPGQPPTPVGYATPPGLGTNPPGPTNGLALASMWVGIGSLVWWCMPGSVLVAAPLAVCALVMGLIARRQTPHGPSAGYALTGIILGTVNAGITAVLLAMFGFLAFAFTRQIPAPPPPPPARPATIPAMPSSENLPRFPSTLPAAPGTMPVERS